MPLHNVGIVVEDLGRAIDFFRELGLELEGRATIEGEWAGRVTGLGYFACARFSSSTRLASPSLSLSSRAAPSGESRAPSSISASAAP